MGACIELQEFVGADPELVRRFKDYHAKNQWVWEEFRTAAFAMKVSGRDKYSAWTIIQKIRWHRDLHTTGCEFKINNDFIALYARALMANYPILNSFFELRTMKANRRKISHEERSRMVVRTQGELF